MEAKRCLTAMTALSAVAATIFASPIEEVVALDEAADAAVIAIRSSEELAAKQREWRAAWLDAMGGLPSEQTPLNASVTGAVECDGFRMENIVFESLPGVFVTAHLALPTQSAFQPPHPLVLMPLGHSDIGLLNPRYTALFAMAARAGFAVLSWDPLSQGERRQSPDPRFDTECAIEHARLGARSWLVGWNFARFRVWDAMRVIDYAQSRPDLDCSCLGIMGTSGGGTMSTYMQALDSRIKVAFPNCYVSSLRDVVRERGCHDSEQFFWNMLPASLNHAAMLAMGQPRVALAMGSRWQDYFPHVGAESTFAVLTNLAANLGLPGPFWHFSCDGPHGLPPSTRAAQTDWMRHCILGAEAPKSLATYRALDADGTDENDPANRAPLPFSEDEFFCTPTHQVRDLSGFRSLYTIVADEADRLAAERARHPKTREELREIARRRAAIRPLADLPNELQPTFDHSFDWWYLEGPYGKSRENEAAILSILGRSVVGRDAENILIHAAAVSRANGGAPVPLRASGADCIAAAHAYAAEPQLFSFIDFNSLPPSWTAAVKDPDPTRDSYATAVWGALQDYDWPDLIIDAPVDPAATTSANATGIIYENDFAQRRSTRAIFGSTSANYPATAIVSNTVQSGVYPQPSNGANGDNIVPALVGENESPQPVGIDGWRRLRATQSLVLGDVKMKKYGDNSSLRFEYGNNRNGVAQPIGNKIGNGTLRMVLDMRLPTQFGDESPMDTTERIGVALGNDTLYDGVGNACLAGRFLSVGVRLSGTTAGVPRYLDSNGDERTGSTTLKMSSWYRAEIMVHLDASPRTFDYVLYEQQTGNTSSSPSMTAANGPQVFSVSGVGGMNGVQEISTLSLWATQSYAHFDSIRIWHTPTGASQESLIYQNSFSKRVVWTKASVLTDTAHNDVAAQDGWCTQRIGYQNAVAFDEENPSLMFCGDELTTGYAGQPLGMTIRTGKVTIQADIRPPRGWVDETGSAWLRLGGDGHLVRESGTSFLGKTAAGFGFNCDSNDAEYGGLFTNCVIVAYRGNGSGGGQVVRAPVAVEKSHWHRFVAKVRVEDGLYDVNVYDMGETHPTLATATPAVPVASFTDLPFRTAKESLGGISSVSASVVSTRSNFCDSASPVLFDNIRITRKESFVIIIR